VKSSKGGRQTCSEGHFPFQKRKLREDVMKRSLWATAVVLAFSTMQAEAQDNPLIGKLEGVTVLTDVVPAKYNEAPELAALVAAGKLPPVE
jgi:hypothetical protein